MICLKCGEDIKTAYTTDVGGVKHMTCYRQDHPFKDKLTFSEVLNNWDDQVLVRQILMEYVPQDIKNEIVNCFNSCMRIKDI